MLSNIPSNLINDESRDCPICFNETNGLKMTFHQYLKYERIWRNNETPNNPLVKCIKCNNYICSVCIIDCKKCPFNCHNLDEERTTMNDDKIYL